MAASGILFGQTFMQDKLCNNSESGEMEHHHQVRHVVAAQSSNVGAPPPFAQFWVAMSHPLDGRTVASAEMSTRPTGGAYLQISDGDC